MGDPRRLTASAPARRGIPPLRRLLRQREGGGSPSPACTYGRVGWDPRRRCLGGGGAGGGVFGVGASFSGGGALRGSSSSRATCGRSRPGGVLGLPCLPSDPRWRWIRWLEIGARRGRRLLSSSGSRSSSARWRCRRVRVLAVVVYRHKFRRGAAGGLCGIFQQGGRSQAVVRRWWMVFVAGAGGVAVLRSGSSSPTYCTLFSVLYRILCMWCSAVEYT